MLPINQFATPLRLGKLIYNDWESPPHIRDFNNQAMKLLCSNDLNRLIISCCIRSGKSQFHSIILPLYFLLLNPTKKVILISSTAERASLFSSTVRNLMEKFGHINSVSLDPKWRSRDKIKTIQGGTLDSFGAGSSVAGLGAHLLICDDIYKNQEQADSPTQRTKINEWFQAEALSRLEPGGKAIYVSSRRHIDDLTGSLLKLNDNISSSAQKWVEIKYPAINKDGEALWPSRYDINRLEQIRDELEQLGMSSIWHSLYMNDPILGGNTEWGDTLVNESILVKEFPEFAKIIISIDPAISLKDQADSTAILVCGYTSDGCCYIVDGRVGRMNTQILQETIITLNSIHKPQGIILECNGFQELIAENLMITNPNLPLHKFVSKTDKEARIKILITPLLHRGHLKIKWCQMGRVILTELQQYPSAQHDDCVDSLSLNIGLYNMLSGKTQEIYEPLRYI